MHCHVLYTYTTIHSNQKVVTTICIQVPNLRLLFPSILHTCFFDSFKLHKANLSFNFYVLNILFVYVSNLPRLTSLVLTFQNILIPFFTQIKSDTYSTPHLFSCHSVHPAQPVHAHPHNIDCFSLLDIHALSFCSKLLRWQQFRTRILAHS